MSPVPQLPPLLLGLLLAINATATAHTHTVHSTDQNWRPSFCGGNLTIGYPFWIATNNTTNSTNDYCGRPQLQLSCQNRTPVLSLTNDTSYYITNINYSSQTLILRDPALTSSACPKSRRNFTLGAPATGFLQYDGDHTNLTYLLNCSNSKSFPGQRLPCNGSRSSYVLVDGLVREAQDWWRLCEVGVVAPVQLVVLEEMGLVNFDRVVKKGVRVNWSSYRSDDCRTCEESGGRCGNSSWGTCLCKNSSWSDGDCRNTPGAPGAPGAGAPGAPGAPGAGAPGAPGKWEPFIGIIIFLAVAVTSIPIAILIVHYNFHSLANPLSLLRKMKFMSVETFLRAYGELKPKRYKYADVRKMTYFFRDKLGEGGYGSVFRGRLTDGRLVAVKVLNDSKGDGEEFINEVASISSTSHVNVVTLLGFCSEGSRRALIYEFMPNGSLERFIYVKEQRDVSPLGWDKLYTIALGIARGLEYLHSGCNTKILHFDIKPHNILLDENFCPKIADFGLAKLCLSKNSVVSMKERRGTFGYIAPEVCFPDFGDVSSKSDVYSYGMMVLEMVGGRRNIEPKAERPSEVYFPYWIYDHLSTDGGIKSCVVINDVQEEEARKMVLVGLWCIQTMPSDRPSMRRVIDMLEGSIGDLPIPPKPHLFSTPQSRHE